MKLTQFNLIKNHNYTTKSVVVEGIKKQYLNIIVSGFIQTDSFFVFGDNNLIDHNIKILSNDEVQIETIISKNIKKITICYKEGNNLYVLYTLKVTAIYKIKLNIKKIFLLLKRLFIVFGRGMRFLWREHHMIIPPTLWKKYIDRFVKRVRERGEILFNPFIQSDYLKWIEEFESDDVIKKEQYEPLFSILVPVYNIDSKSLSECLDSVLKQSYSNFEICIVDDCSTNKETLDALEKYEKLDSRIVVRHRKENGHISLATNDALNMAQGDFICLLDNDDTLAKDALYENVLALNKNKDLDFIYSDEDKLDLKGNRCEPHFKADYSPDTLLGINYITHFAVLRKSLVNSIGGFTEGLEGVQDHDLFLRVVEKTNKIHHIPKILYHWRMVEGSTSMTIDNKGYAVERGKKAIENALKRRGTKGIVESVDNSTVYRVEYLYDKEPSVSIIIPTRDFADVTEKCISSIYEKTKYSNFEVIIIDNNSEKQETFDLFEKYKNERNNFKVIKADMEFNYSAINNLGIKKSQGDVIVLLNNDTEIITEDWLKIMVGYAIQPHVGAVGPKLLYPDMTIQHGGVLIGVGDAVAAHSFIGHPREDRGVYGRLIIPYNYSAVTAACLVIERNKFNQVCGLEENLKVAYNDVDFNLKLLDHGYFNLFVPQVELIHYESKSRGLDTTSEKYKQFLSESNYMHNKWKKYIENDPYYNPNFSKIGLYMLDREKKGNENAI